MHLVCLNGHLTVATYLIEERACNSACRYNVGSAPVFEACCGGHLDIVKYLVEEQRCDPASSNNNDWTLLHIACQKNYLKL